MKKDKIVKQNTFTEFLLYTAPNGKVKVKIFLRDETVWLTQAKIAELFDVDRSVITKHLQNIFESGELQENAVCANYAHTADDGKTYKTKFYNLDAIISVGYRVNSRQATHFRIWATQVLKEYIIKGFAMDDERLKNPNNIFGQDYFEEQLARITGISAPVNAGSIRKLPIFTRSAALIMIRMKKSPSNFLLLSKTNFTLQFPGRPRQKSFITE